MHLMADYKLNVQMRTACHHFRRGLEDVVLVDWLQMFDHEEFQTLVAGAEVPISIEDFKLHTAYSGKIELHHDIWYCRGSALGCGYTTLDGCDVFQTAIKSVP